MQFRGGMGAKVGGGGFHRGLQPGELRAQGGGVTGLAGLHEAQRMGDGLRAGPIGAGIGNQGAEFIKFLDQRIKDPVGGDQHGVLSGVSLLLDRLEQS
ncbi:hypothetical protein GCM10010909_01680 [Acidocella aquatica]|uniref:Uncharacterized protein n=1 Tax=Acidocella aquatica TaxID=1922313 RepID=A0ABQ6A2L6_9PROT|nr:hypothetical protein GCM10010909_01680 [Acidocella aquatica]